MQRSEETKQNILHAAGQLFSERGFDAVTMREIAKAAGCSHTTIYLYFKDKEALLNQLAMGPLEELQQQMESAWHDDTLPADERLKSLTRRFIRFCLLHRNMYNILFMTKASRVDEAEPHLAVQQMRNQLFGLLRQAIQECLHDADGEQALAYARIYFYALHGIVGTYMSSAESFEQLTERLSPTFDLAVDVMLAGFRGVGYK